MFNSGKEDYCDLSYAISPDWKGSGWYRLTGAAGSKIPEKAPGYGHCGTHAVGWMRGVHPSTPGAKVVATICFDYGGTTGDCYKPVNITVINCGIYYLYDLPHAPDCFLRYCGSL